MHLATVACRSNYRGWDVKDYKIRHILKRWSERWWCLGPERRKMDRCEGYFKNRIDDLVTNWMYREREKSRMTFRDLTRAGGVHWLSGLSCKTNSRTPHWCIEYRELLTELGNDLKNKIKLCAYFWYSAFLIKLCELKAIIYMRETHACLWLWLPPWLSGYRICLHCRRHRRHGFHPRVGKIPWRRKRKPTPVFLSGKSHGQRSLAV